MKSCHDPVVVTSDENYSPLHDVDHVFDPWCLRLGVRNATVKDALSTLGPPPRCARPSLATTCRMALHVLDSGFTYGLVWGTACPDRHASISSRRDTTCPGFPSPQGHRAAIRKILDCILDPAFRSGFFLRQSRRSLPPSVTHVDKATFNSTAEAGATDRLSNARCLRIRRLSGFRRPVRGFPPPKTPPAGLQMRGDGLHCAH